VTDKIGVPCGIAGATWQCMLQLYINISWRAVRDRRCHLAVHVATHQAGQPNGRHNGYDLSVIHRQSKALSGGNERHKHAQRARVRVRARACCAVERLRRPLYTAARTS
jgi:hypothetical protein